MAQSSTSPLPFHDLPPELLAHIVEFLPRPDLLSIARVCHLFSDLAIRPLYRSITLSGPDLSLSCFRTIATRPLAAQAVRSLSWRFSPYIHYPSRDSNTVPLCIEALHMALPLMVNLRRLQLPVDEVITEDLMRRLTIDYVDQGASSPSDMSMDITPPSSESLLPSLRSIETTSIVSLGALSCRRPITHIKILSVMSFTTLDQLLPHLSRSTGPLRELTVPLQAETSLVEAIHAITSHLPYLTSLNVGAAVTVDLNHCQEFIELIAPALSLLPKLRRLFIPILANEPANYNLHLAIIQRLHKACPALTDACVSVVPWQMNNGVWTPSPFWRSTHVWWEARFPGTGKAQKEAKRRWGSKVPTIKGRASTV